MNDAPRQLTLEEWDARHTQLLRVGALTPPDGGPLGRHVEQGGNLRLRHLRFDNSTAALRLWNFLLTENDRLRAARAGGDKLVGAMKDLGTVPVIAYALPGLRAFYPDGAWWTPCLMECSDHLLERAEAAGIDASFCPVRAMLAAFENRQHFPPPDLLVCSTGAVCDDFSALAQRLERLGWDILWWEMPRRRAPEPDEPSCLLPGGLRAPRCQVDCVRDELHRVANALGETAGVPLDDTLLEAGIASANAVRRVLGDLRQTTYGAEGAALPALEMLVAEMLAIHFCSDRGECLHVLNDLLAEVRSRVERRRFLSDPDAVRVFWVNPVADLRVLNRLETCGGRLCGTDFMFSHALDPIPTDRPPLEALARTALADPMVGPVADRARRIVAECRSGQAEAVVVARIPGASHCPWEVTAIRDLIQQELGLPAIALEIPPVSDALLPALENRLEALLETARARRHS